MKKYIAFVFALFFVIPSFAQKESKFVNKGNKEYKNEKFVDSEVEYRKGLEKNKSSFSANFNLGNALYRQEKYSDAAEQFSKAISLAGDDKQRLASSYHNLGNSLLQENKIQELLDKNVSYSAIGRTIGVNRLTVSSHIERYGLKTIN